MTRFLRPSYFFFGIAVGFLACAVMGYIVSNHAKFKNFTHFFHSIQPQLQYYPTSHELLATARQNVSKDKILVLIGGNSIFRGVGQDPEELWSDELQKRLGDKFKVLNYAVDSATMTSFAGVAFRILSQEYPKIIFVSTSLPLPAGPIDGLEVYNYLFWDAYYKKLFHAQGSLKDKIHETIKNQLKTSKGMEQHILSYLDSKLYFRNLWNWVGYHFMFTVWTNQTPKSPFKARARYEEIKQDFIKKILQNYIKTPEGREGGINILKNYILNYTDLTKTKPHVNEDTIKVTVQNYAEAFMQEERSKILCVITSENPAFLSLMPAKLRLIHPIIINEFSSKLKKLGYHVIDVGQNYSSEDYVDLLHFSSSGGNKTAEQVAQKIDVIAKENGYI